jgi:hypothetical protein
MAFMRLPCTRRGDGFVKFAPGKILRRASVFFFFAIAARAALRRSCRS